jgi:ABC-2 type transport system permease protein
MLRQTIHISRTMLSVYYAYMVEYRAELLFWVLSGTFPLILMGLWAEAAQSGQFSLGPTALVRYFLAVFLVRQFTVVWVIWEFEREVVEGKLSPYLLQPLTRYGGTFLAMWPSGLPDCPLPSFWWGFFCCCILMPPGSQPP